MLRRDLRRAFRHAIHADGQRVRATPPPIASRHCTSLPARMPQWKDEGESDA
jgi:hypothetical protein